MGRSGFLRTILNPTTEDIFASVFVRTWLAWRILPFKNRRLGNSKYTNERSAEDLAPHLRWIKRRQFILFGDNWLDQENPRPIAVLWSFNEWKRDFIATFLPEYRVAVVRHRYPLILILLACLRLKREGLCFITWGYKEPTKAKVIARILQLKFLRMEDGFIRSASLGAEHSVPESLVLDSSGLYFDARGPSDLEKILNSFDFSAHRDLLDQASNAMEVMKQLGATKYNLRTFRDPTAELGPKHNERILVLGQVEADASILLGSAKGWTNALLLELAISENPSAEIIYRPHPDVVKGFRKRKKINIPANVTLLEDADVPLPNLFRKIDRVYTITSLSGFEALVHGVAVTVVGAPFYAGWGLTDDRQLHPRRNRKLSLVQLFCGAYLLYPRYRADPTNSEKLTGLLAALISVTGAAEFGLARSLDSRVPDKEVSALYGSEYWPVLLKEHNREVLESRNFRKALQVSGAYHVFARAGRAGRGFLAYVLAGRLRETSNLDVYLRSIRSLIWIEDFGKLISDLWQLRPDPLLLDHWIWFCHQTENTEALTRTLRTATDEAFTEATDEKKKQHSSLTFATHLLESRQIQESEIELRKFALLGNSPVEALSLYAEICRLKFDYVSSAFLLKAVVHANPLWRNGSAFVHLSTANNMLGFDRESLVSLCSLAAINSEKLGTVATIEDDLKETFGDLPFVSAFIACDGVAGGGAQSLKKARTLILNERHSEAEALLRRSFDKHVDRRRFVFLFSQALSFQGKLNEAQSLLTDALAEKPSPQLFSEALRVAILKGDYMWASEVLRQAEALDFDVGEMYKRKILLGLGKIKESYLSFRESKSSRRIRTYIRDRHKPSIPEIQSTPSGKTIVVASSGPGDEIRFASRYPEIVRQLPQRDVWFTCDPRLFPLLQRSFPQLSFASTARTRSLSRKTDLRKYRELPASELHVFSDNAGWREISSASCVALDTDLIGDTLEGYESFDGQPYFFADTAKIEEAKKHFFGIDKPIVGISWRSSLTTHTRNEHYLDIEMLAPIFELSGIQFVNLQYDECKRELDKVEAVFPGKLIDLEGVDQYNDFEAVAACMSHMDLIISPITTVTELAGALGRPTWLLSNSSELHWRKRPGTNIDVWHKSVRHIEGSILGNKLSLVEQLRSELEKWRSNQISFT